MNWNILDFIPQRPPFVMVEDILSDSPDQTRAFLKVRVENLFVQDGRFTAPGLIEHMAQSFAAISSFNGRNEKIALPKMGFIGAIKDLKILSLPPVGAELISYIYSLQVVLSAQIVKMITLIDDEEIASCELKIFLQA